MPKTPSPRSGDPTRKPKRTLGQVTPVTTPRRGFKVDLRAAAVALKAVQRHLRKLNAPPRVLEAIQEAVRCLDRECK